ncbi:MAG: hypothetical protein WC867_04195 [Candidatus Pacearchaeota archaeon]|jgi:cytochrome bd-type quinol oxidase subunit 2
MKRKIYFYPKTKIGKVSIYGVLIGFLLLIMKTNNILIPFPTMILMGLICIFGITSFFSIIKNKDYALLLFVSSIIGILGILFTIGEILYPH